MALSDVKLVGATAETVRQTVHSALFPSEPLDSITVKECSGRSGAAGFLLSKAGLPVIMLKITGGSSLHTHPATSKRIGAATKVLREVNNAPAMLLVGPDFYAEAAAGTSVMKDFFHFQDDCTGAEIASLLARFHATPTGWFTPLRGEYVERDASVAPVLRAAPLHSQCWHLPWSGIDTGKVVMGMGNVPDEITQKVLRLQIDSGVWKKVMTCEAFYPVCEAAKRQVVIHGDFKPDNVLRGANGELIAIDYDLCQVGPAVHEFGFMLMMWYGPRQTTYEYREAFVSAYLTASGLESGTEVVREFMLDCEVNTLVTFPGLLANIYDKEVPLLRGVPHPTAKATAGSVDDSPTGLEIVDLLAAAVAQVRADATLIERSVKDGLVPTLFAQKGLGSPLLFEWLQLMQANNMLRLFGIAPAE